MAIVIMVETPDKETQEAPFFGEMTIGRSSKADFQINDDSALSSIHCKITTKKDGKIHFEDLNSSNGSFFNSQKIKEMDLKVGDVITIGRSLLYIDQKRLSSKETLVIGKS